MLPAILVKYSFLWVSAILILIIPFVLARFSWTLRLSILGVLVLILLAVWWLFRPESNTSISTLPEAEAMFQNGKPTLVELYSEYCIGCMAIEPQVDRLETDLGNKANVLRVSIHTDLGRDLSKKFDFEFSPLFIILDTSGQEIWRGSDLPNSRQVLAPL